MIACEDLAHDRLWGGEDKALLREHEPFVVRGVDKRFGVYATRDAGEK
jgi:hypothetical protein